MKQTYLFILLTFLPLLVQGQFKTRPQYIAPKAITAPVVDGVGDDDCWVFGEWATLENDWLLQTWVRRGKVYPKPFDPDDFSGRFKITWDQDYLYILAEFVDDIIHDNIVDPLQEYWKDDCFTVFIDEDASRDYHNDNYSAFAYHIAAVTKDVVDFDINEQPQLFNDHLEVEIKSEGDLHTWEIAIKIYDDTFVRGGDNTPVKLYPGKIMGFNAAYCDDDGGDMDNFVGWAEGGLRSSSEADVFGTLILSEGDLIKQIDQYSYENNAYINSNSMEYSYDSLRSREALEYEIEGDDLTLISESYEAINKEFGTFVPEYKYDYDYDNESLIYASQNYYEDGILVKEELLYYDTNEAIADGSIEKTYFYTETGNPATIITKEYKSSNLVNLSRYLFEYTEKAKLANRIFQSWQNNAWVTTTIDSVFYSDFYKPVRKSIYTLSKGTMYLISEEKLFYNDFLLPDSILITNSNGAYKIEYESEKHQTNTLTYFENDGTEWIPYLQEMLTDDLTILKKTWDGSDWNTYKKTEQNFKLGYMADNNIYLKKGESFIAVFTDTTYYEKGQPLSRTVELKSFTDESILNGENEVYDYFTKVQVISSNNEKTIDELPDEELFQLYPNPATNRLNLTIPENSTNIYVRIFNSNGKIMYMKRLNFSTNNISMNIYDLPAGIYIAEIITNTHLKRLKLIKK